MNSILFNSQKNKCSLHNTKATFYCSCNENLCRNCLNIHYHPEMKINTYQDTKNKYYEELKSVEAALTEIKTYDSNINESLEKIIAISLSNYLAKNFFIEENIFIDSAKLVNCETEVPSFELMNELLNKNYPEKLRHCVISKLKKFKILQNCLIKNANLFMEEFSGLISRLLTSSEYNLEHTISFNRTIYYTPAKAYLDDSQPIVNNTINETLSDDLCRDVNSSMTSKSNALNSSYDGSHNSEDSLDISDYLKTADFKDSIASTDKLNNYNDQNDVNRRIQELTESSNFSIKRQSSHYQEAVINTKNCTACGVAFTVDRDTMRWKYRCDPCQAKVRKDKNSLGNIKNVNTHYQNNNSNYKPQKQKMNDIITNVCISCKENFIGKNGAVTKHCYKCKSKFKTYNNY
jgi:hypothetical protein